MKAVKKMMMILMIVVLSCVLFVPDESFAATYKAGTYKTTDTILVRSKPSSKATRLGILGKNKKIKVKKVEKKTWGKISFKGKTAYIHLYHTKKAGGKASAKTYSAKKGQVLYKKKSTKSKKLKKLKKGTKVKVIDQDASWLKVKYKGKTGYLHIGAKTKKVKGYKLTSMRYLYKKASTKSKKLKKIKKGTIVRVKSRSGHFGKISYKGKTGYVYLGSSAKKVTVTVKTKFGKTKASAKSLGKSAVSAAKKKIGCHYVFGASHTQTALSSEKTHVFDCSSLVCWAYYQAGYSEIGNHTTKASLYRYGKNVATYTSNRKKPSSAAGFDKVLRVGDILIFSHNGKPSGVHHTGLYVGNGKFIHAPYSGERVRIESLCYGHYHNQLYTVRRVNP